MNKKLLTAFIAVLTMAFPGYSIGQVPNLGSAANFAVFTSVGAFNSLGTTSITGDIGTDVGAFSGFPPGVVFGDIHIADAESAQAALDLDLAYTELSGLTCGSVLTVTMGGGQTLTPGIYCTGAAATLTGNIILDGEGDLDALFVIQIDGAFSTATLSSVTLINGANVCNVYWQVNGAVEIGISSAFQGNLVVNGAISLYLNSTLNGRALSKVGAIDLNSNLIQMTPSDIYYADSDADGFGDPLITMMSCSAIPGYVTNNLDCDDTNSLINPDGIEICNAIDDNCDGMVDNFNFNVAIYPEDTAFSCKSVEFEFSTDSCEGCSYQWYKNDNVILGANASTYSTKYPAHYSVEVTVDGGCTFVSEHTFLQMNFYPNANIYHPNGLNLCAPTPGNNILLKVGYDETNTYQWYMNGTPYVGYGSDSWRIFPLEEGLYYCSITSSYGCNRSTPIRHVTNACRLEAQTNDALVIYPNPASNQISVALNYTGTANQATIQIVNLLGEVVYSEIGNDVNSSFSQNISISFLAPGMYSMRCVLNDEIFTTQFIKQ